MMAGGIRHLSGVICHQWLMARGEKATSPKRLESRQNHQVKSNSAAVVVLMVRPEYLVSAYPESSPIFSSHRRCREIVVRSRINGRVAMAAIYRVKLKWRCA